MNRSLRISLTALAFLPLALASSVLASSTIPLNTRDHVRASDAVFRGTVVGLSCFKDANGLIYTSASLQVDEELKGTFPPILLLVHRGGRVGNDDEYCGLSPRFITGAEYLMLVSRGSDGRLHATQGEVSAIKLQRDNTGAFVPADETLLAAVRSLTQDGQSPGADVTDQVGEIGPESAAPTGMLGGTASRFLQPDRGEPIPYLIDAASLPAGMTLTQATNAVQQALNAWTAVTSLKFRLEAIQSFGQGADLFTNDTGKLRIQLHDNFNRINTANVLGMGGRGGTTSVLPGVGWDIGGNVAGNEFVKTSYGYVILEATNTFMQTLSTFAEVLCHEIGHALNLAHSSEVVTNDPVLSNAIMYFQAHADGRGATLGSYDPPVIQQIYPSNTAPFGFNRMMDVTTASPQPNIAGINEVVLGYDLQGTNLTALLTNVTVNNGTFSTIGTTVRYTPSGAFPDQPRLDPAGTGAYDRFYARLWDGTNGSPYFTVRVISFNRDTSPATSDGIPDNWMISYFGNADPAVGTNHRATNDFDGDKLTNLQEYRAGTIPTNSVSAQRATLLSTDVLQWQAKPYEAYQVFCSTNLTVTNWSLVASIVPTNTTGLLTNFSNRGAARQFFRIFKVP